jgi:hypothetical protein
LGLQTLPSWTKPSGQEQFGQGANLHCSPVLPTALPSGQTIASSVQASCFGWVTRISKLIIIAMAANPPKIIRILGISFMTLHVDKALFKIFFSDPGNKLKYDEGISNILWKQSLSLKMCGRPIEWVRRL